MDICPQVILIRRNETLRLYAEHIREVLSWTDYDTKRLNAVSADFAKNTMQYTEGRFPYDPSNVIGRVLLRQDIMVGNYGLIFNLRLQAESKASAIEAMLAVREYELKHGKLPESLESMIPEYLLAVPTDFIDGLPIRYSPPARATWTVGWRQNVSEPLPAPEKKDDREQCIFRLPPLTTQ
jgi:hypothetical protein